jgi:hypothetical protein
MAMLVRTICAECGKPTIYRAAKKAYVHRDGWVRPDGTSKGCSTQYPAPMMQTIIPHF